MPDSLIDSLDVILETAELKHESVLSNIRSIDIKASITIAFFGVLLLPSFEVSQWKVISIFQFVVKLIPTISVLVGILFCLLTLFPRSTISYARLSTLRIMFANGMRPSEIKAQLFSLYQMASEFNDQIARKKFRFTKISFIFLFISIFALLLTLIFKGVIDA
jgi:hypothetical protein